MTALDQAFIKAYMHQNAVPAAAVLSSARPVRLDEVLADPAKQESPEPPTDPRAGALAEAVVNALERLPARVHGTAPADPTPSERPETRLRLDEAHVQLAKSNLTSRGVASGQRAKTSAPQAVKTSQTLSLEQLGIASAIPTSTPPGSQGTVAVVSQPPAAPSAEEPAAPEVSAIAQPGPFRPALVVDRFLWSSGCSRLDTVASEQLDRLAEGITFRGVPSRSAVAVCGSRRGEGCTTLLLCVARRLAAQGRRVMLMDADFDQPMLARRLGLLPEVGWEDVLWRDLPLADAAIESVEDRLAILPLRGASPFDPRQIGAPVDPAPSVDLLRQEYDLVLIDLGRFDFSSHRASAVLQSARRWIDAVVVVHNVRATPRMELEHTRRRLREAGIAEAGVAENFV